MQLVDIVFRERSGYRDMQLRPFASDATGELINQLDHDTRGGTDLSPAALSRVAGRIIRPQASVQTAARIANGWGEKRFMFIMTVMVRDSRTARQVLEISGYTDHVGAVNSLRGIKLDEDMCMYFNSVTEVNQSYMDTPTGSGWRTQIAGSNHLIGPQTMPDFSRDRLSPGTMTMRPEDVFQSSPKDVLSTSFSRRAEEGRFMDMRNSFTQPGLRMSNRWNDSSTRYLYRSIKALGTANEGEVYGEGGGFERDTSQVMRDARAQVRERSFTSLPPFAELASDTNILDQGFITYGELVAMNPDFAWDDVKVFFERPETARDFRNTTDWSGRDNTTIAAIQIARALPTYMAFHHLAAIQFESNNYNHVGEPVIIISECLPILGKTIDQRALGAFEQRLITELFVDMLPWENCMFELRIKASIAGDVVVQIQLEGEEVGEFVFPVFCDSLVAPVVVDDRKCIDQMGETLTSIVDSLGSTQQGQGTSIITDTTGYSF